MNFTIGQYISAYDDEGLPCKGRISSFDGTDPVLGPMAQLRLMLKNSDGRNQYARICLDSAHPLTVDSVKHSKETFLAAASRCSPVLYFKSSKDRRDYLESLWAELANFSQDEY